MKTKSVLETICTVPVLLQRQSALQYFSRQLITIAGNAVDSNHREKYIYFVVTSLPESKTVMDCLLLNISKRYFIL